MSSVETAAKFVFLTFISKLLQVEIFLLADHQPKHHIPQSGIGPPQDKHQFAGYFLVVN